MRGGDHKEILLNLMGDQVNFVVTQFNQSPLNLHTPPFLRGRLMTSPLKS